MKPDTFIIDQIRKYFQDKPVLKAYLFGSYVRGTQNETSDVDILVELDYSKKIGLEFFKMQNELEAILKHKVDLVSNEAISPLIKPKILKERRLVYEK
ncbi:type VII toxin-antitoxin system MntA family adenylyltransferase antitoxin [Algoriphagus mannitolivorans]|uniref:type VII toxin-antitoxin system MntA family adenylyltransferase antitoxin n=1 Tax=Algoriphagus mannitolivorans TaxID=226504 RepID=UPI0003F79314|nr:nucleotidyltransferase domain-containing protein [Algoriphagus mannitolivorans]